MLKRRGFRSGLYIPDAFTDPAVKPETLDTYEAGIKSEVLNHRLRLNAAAFFNNWKEIQEAEFTSTTEYFLNAAAAHVYGFDFDATAQLTEGFSLRADLSFAHGRFTNCPCAPSYFLTDHNPVCPAEVHTTAFDFTGNHTPHTPDFSDSVSANYTHNTSIGRLKFTLTDSYMSSFFWEPDNIIREPSVNLLSASIGWNSVGERWSVRLYGRNLLNRLYFVSAESIGLNTEASPGEPHTYGFVVGMHL